MSPQTFALQAPEQYVFGVCFAHFGVYVPSTRGYLGDLPIFIQTHWIPKKDAESGTGLKTSDLPTEHPDLPTRKSNWIDPSSSEAKSESPRVR